MDLLRFITGFIFGLYLYFKNWVLTAYDYADYCVEFSKFPWEVDIDLFCYYELSKHE